MLQQTWKRMTMIKPPILFGGLFMLSLVIYAALIPVPRADGQLIGSDGIGYYSYVRSLVLDQDLDFTNEYTYYLGSATQSGLTPIGRPANKYALGPAILWMPFFLVAHGIALLATMVGVPIAADGFGYLYQAAISIGSIVYGTLGFWLAFTCARRFFSQASALTAIVLLWFSSNAVYYMIFEPSMAHMTSLFSVALVFTMWFCWFREHTYPPLPHALLLGAAGGLVMLVRLQDAFLLLVPYGYLIYRLIQAVWKKQYQEARHWLWLGMLVAVSTIIVFLPQLLVWQRLYGTWITSPYASDHIPAFYWTMPQIGKVLFSSFHGLFLWHPVYLLALGGLIVVGRRSLWLAFALVGALAVQVYLVAAWWAWWQGDSFGGRMFLNAMWIWTLGLSGLLEWLTTKPMIRRLAMGVGLGLVVWNGLSLIQYRLGLVPMSAPLTWEQMTIERLKIPLTILRKFVR